jgi:hypothetical protein
MRAHYERNFDSVNLILIVRVIAHARLRNSISGLCHRSLVAFRAVRGLLLRAKDLFVEATLVASVLSRWACYAGVVALRQTFVH